MMLLTKQNIKDLSEDTSEKGIENIIVKVKLFNPIGAGTWYLYEYNEKYDEAVAFVNLGNPQFAELGYVSLKELRELKLPLGMSIERDLHFKPTPLKEIMSIVQSGGHI